MKDIKQMTDKELIDLYQSFYEGVYVLECYGVKDYQLMIAAEAELERSGYRIVRRVEVMKREEFEKKGDRIDG